MLKTCEYIRRRFFLCYVTRADKYDISMDNSMISNAIWEKHARVSFSKTIEDKFESLKTQRVYIFPDSMRNSTITYYSRSN